MTYVQGYSSHTILAKDRKKPKYTLTRDWVSKIWSIHIMQYYAIVKRMRKQSIYCMKKAREKTVCIMCYLLHKILKSGKNKNINPKLLEYVYRMSERTIKNLKVAA